MTLRAALIRLAREQPSLRRHLVPLLRQAGQGLDSGVEKGVLWVDTEPDKMPTRRRWPPPGSDLVKVEKYLAKNWRAVAGSLLFSGADLTVTKFNMKVDERRVLTKPSGDLGFRLPLLFRTTQWVGIPSFMAHVGSGVVWLNTKGQVTQIENHSKDPVLLPLWFSIARDFVLSNQSNIETLMDYRALSSNVYIRFGRWRGTSRVFLDPEGEKHGPDGFDRKFEAGVSVFSVTPRLTGGFVLERPRADQALYSIGTNYLEYMAKRSKRSIANGHLFLLRGDWVNLDGRRIYGADGEPVLEPGTIQIIKKLKPEEVFIGDRSLKERLNL